MWEASAPTVPRAPWPLVWLVGPSSRHEGKFKRQIGTRKALGETFQTLAAVSPVYKTMIVYYPKLIGHLDFGLLFF